MSYSDEAIRHEINERIMNRINAGKYHQMPVPFDMPRELMAGAFKKGSLNAYLSAAKGVSTRKKMSLEDYILAEVKRLGEMVDASKDDKRRLKKYKDIEANKYEFEITKTGKKRNIIKTKKASKPKLPKMKASKPKLPKMKAPKHLIEKVRKAKKSSTGKRGSYMARVKKYVNDTGVSWAQGVKEAAKKGYGMY